MNYSITPNEHGEMSATIDNLEFHARFLDGIDRIAYHFGRWLRGDERTATLKLRNWAKRFHGNAPSGTPYGSYRIALPNGERRSITLCF